VNLSELTGRIYNITDYAPNNEAYRNEMHRLINDSYLSLWASRAWTFAKKTDSFPLLPDLNHARNGNVTVTTSDGQRNVVFSLNIPVFTTRRDYIEGNIIELHGREYTIGKVVNNQILFLTEPVRHSMDSTGVSPAVITGYEGWTIKFRYYRLPSDCIELEYIGHRDDTGVRGKWEALSPRAEETAGLDIDESSSYAEAYVAEPPMAVRNAETLTLSWTDAPLAADGDFSAGEYYEFCWALVGPDGYVGPLSEAEMTVVPAMASGSASMTMAFTTFGGGGFRARDPLVGSRGGPEPLEGYRKRVFYNANLDRTTGDTKGLALWREVSVGWSTRGVVTGDNVDANIAVEADDTDVSIDILHKNGLHPGNPRYVEYDGQWWRIRPYPRPDSFRQEYGYTVTASTEALREMDYFNHATVRYLKNPAKLIGSTDTPEMPYEFHSLIVYRTLIEVYTKSGNASLSQLYQSRYDKGVKLLEKRYTVHEDINWRRGQYASGSRHGVATWDINSLQLS